MNMNQAMHINYIDGVKNWRKLRQQHSMDFPFIYALFIWLISSASLMV